ncbi:hypothetical protein [Streptomyces mirabilis]|uniref:hypothetical protein n=1 Tax=Streptomyces mirabilis TaxID=68239 RepID=UPI00331B53D0
MCCRRSRGLTRWLVNARDVKNLSGPPKPDKLDAVRLAKLAERGRVRASFVPPKAVRQLRDITLTLADLAKGNLVKKKAALIEALTGQFEDHHARLLRVLLVTIDHLT